MAKTKSELAEYVAKEVLGVVDVVESLSGEQNARIESNYLAILETLREEGVAHWDADSIPEKVFTSLADVVGYKSANGFGVPGALLVDPSTRLSIHDRGIRELHRMASVQKSEEPVKGEYM